MKLLNELAEQIKLLGPLKRAWFTTFNLNLDFFERHVLSTILEMDKPRNRIDYELMQQRINGTVGEGAIFADKLDIAIFADQRMYDASDLKRTAIDVYAVNPAQLEGKAFSKRTLFHPKVIYLESEDGKAILGAGSANLTLSGWSTNQEVFVFRKVATDEQRQAIAAFFAPLFSDAESQTANLAGQLWHGSPTDWQFVHSFRDSSFQAPSFLEALWANNPDKQLCELAVWSPYFPENLAAFIAHLEDDIQAITKTSLPLSLKLIPDRVENKQIRTKWSDELGKLQDEGKVSFYNNMIEKHESAELCHAKVWFTTNKCAIGSWNFTTPGSNRGLESGELVNIEAGLIFEHQAPIEAQLGKQFNASKSDFMSSEDLEKHALEVSELLPFYIRVVFDWRHFKYVITVESNEDATGYQLYLPDCPKPFDIIELVGTNGELLVHEPKELLAKHSFEVRYHGGIVYRGFILEAQTELRRIERFESLDDIFTNLISGISLEANANAILRSELITDQDFEDESGEVVSENEAKPTSLSYFRLFQAFAEFDSRLADIKSADVLEQYAFVVPGCLAELKEKIAIELEGKVTVFNWYMLQEFNALVSKASMMASKELAKDNNLLIERIDALRLSEPEANKAPKLGNQKYRKLIQKECNYVY